MGLVTMSNERANYPSQRTRMKPRAAERQRWGLQIAMNAMLDLHQLAVCALCRRTHVRRLDAFGPVLRDDFEIATGDLDFWVEFKALAPADYANACFALKEGLEALFSRSVDLVIRRFGGQSLLQGRRRGLAPAGVCGLRRRRKGAVMSTVVAEIEVRIRSLRVEDKTDLLRDLIADLDGPADPGVERAWLEEAQRRHREMIEGKG